MTRRLILGLILAAAVATPGPWPFGKKKGTEAAKSSAPRPEGFESQYTGGTVAAIPQFSTGKLDLTDRTALRFHYGKPSWSLPYSKITSIEVADKRPNEFAEFVKVPFMKKKRVFTITFEGDKGLLHNVLLEMQVAQAIEALPLLEERSGKHVAVEGASNPDGWWGDRYWKTERNTQVWDDATPQKSVARKE